MTLAMLVRRGFRSTSPQAELPLGHPVEVEQPVGMLSRAQLVDRILALNSTTTEAFLATFTLQALQEYHDHLVLVAHEPRGGACSGWVRRGGVPAISCRESRS